MTALARLCPVAPDDVARFLNESEDCRNWLAPMLAALRRLVAVRREGGRIGAAIEREARVLGMAAKTLREKFDRYTHSGEDFAAIIDRRRFPEPGERSELSPAVIAHWQKLCEQNQRKCRPAYRRFIDDWHRGEPAGLEWPPLDPKTMLPAGCTYRNLLRHRPDNFALKAMRHGLGAAMSAHGPQVLTTRIGLWVGSHFVIDDLSRDLRVLLLGGTGQIARVQELGVLDLFSADRFAVHRRPQFERADGSKDSLKEREMRWLLASVFRNFGWSPRGTQILSEGGTAAVREPFAKWLQEQSNGLVTVKMPGQLGKVQALAGWRGRGGGNPRHKAALESHHNLVHNEAANLPAPMGHDRNPPEWLHGIEAETREVIEWMRDLPAEQAAALRVQMLEYWQALALLSEIDLRVARRTDHQLEGWIESGLVSVEHCADLIADRWIGPEEFALLPQSARDRLHMAAEMLPQLRRARRLAPREVFSRGAAELVKLNDAQLALFFTDRALGDDLRRPVRLTSSGMIEITDATAGPSALHFERTLSARDGGSYRLDERTDYDAVLNPFDPAQLWLFDRRGVFLGTSPRIVRASRLDEHAVHLQLGRVSAEKAALLAPLRDRHADAAALIEDIRAHNEAVVNGPQPTPAERRAERQLTSAADAAIDAFGDFSSPTHSDL